MIERRGNRVWRKVVKSYYKLGKKGRVLHVVASMTACLTLSTPAFSAGFVVTDSQTATQQITANSDRGAVLPSGLVQVTNDSGDAVAIELASDLTGVTIENQGSISATSTSDDARGILGDTLGASTITNSGTITVRAEDSAIGIGVDTFENTNVLNTGTIDVAGDTARGIEAGSNGLEGTSKVENGADGLIRVRSESDNAVGIEMDSLHDSATVINAGIIDAAATDGGDVYGIRVENYLHDTSSLENSGSIQIATDPDDGDSSGFGMYLYYGMEDNSRMENSGSISVLHNNDASAYGMSSYYSNGDTILRNTGEITMETKAGTHSGNIYGIHSYQLNDNSRLINSGTITMIQNNNGSSTGLSVGYSNSDSSILNTGTISMVNKGSGRATGISNYSYYAGDAGNIVNTGTISISNQGSGTARGIDTASYYQGQYGLIQNSGTVEVVDGDGNLAENLFSIHTEGAVINTGTLKGQIQSGNLDNRGEIRLPAAANTIDGNFVNRSGAFLGLTLFSDDDPANTRISTISVSGTTTIENGSCMNVDVSTAQAHQNLLAGQTLTGVMTSTGGITADVNGFYVTDNSVLLKFNPLLSSSDTALDLQIEQDMSITAATREGGSLAGAGAGSVLDTLGSSSDAQICAFLGHLNSQTTEAGVARAVTQTAPVGTSQTPTVAAQVATNMGDMVQGRQQSLRGISSGDAMMLDQKVWVKPFGSRLDQSDVDGVNGFTADSYGIGVGADTAYGNGKHMGVAFLYSRAEVETNGLPQETDLNVFNMVVYGSRPVLDDLTLLSLQMGGGFQFTDTSREIQGLNARAESDYTAKNLFARAKVSRSYALGERLTLDAGPMVAYSFLHTPDYQETGNANAFNLNVEGFDAHSLVASIEGDLTWAVNPGLELSAHMALGYDLVDDTTTVHSSFQTGGAVFKTPGIDHSPVVYSAGLGMVKDFGDHFSMDTRYDFEGRGGDFQSHTLSTKLSWAF